MSLNFVGKLGGGGIQQVDNGQKVLILGAGAAGLAAASTFLSQGIDQFLVIEGADHIGGRVQDVEFGGIQVERGANWLQPEEGLIERIAERAGLASHRLSYGESWDARSSDKEVFPEWEVEKVLYEFSNFMEQAVDFAVKCPDGDMTMRDFLVDKKWSVRSDIIHKAIEWYQFDFEYSIPPEQTSISSSNWERCSENSKFVIDQRGFKAIFADVVTHLAQKNALRLNKRVISIDQSQKDKVYVTCDDGSVFCADAVLLTFNLGVLQSRLVAFNPPLPKWKTAAIDHTPVGAFTKIFLKFPHKFWDDKEWIMHMSDQRGYYPTFMNMEMSGLFPQGTNILVGFVVGDEARRVENQPIEETLQEVVSVLKDLYGEQAVPQPTDIMLSGWLNDPLQMGAFSVPHTSKRVIHQLQTSVGRVYFGGEATDEKFAGYVIGGMRSGQREAKRITRQVFGRKIKREGFSG
ncbi:polyamine oxidase 1-like [Asterias rubens]|uniref:polyamine oxidase 1-like n=1 Tax=Asterias rubens TaxID=7604 RepID=UPI0014557E0D|nr:polyamine oxidase 1-like [Asterias rubens]